ncbi:hypothetical protein ABKA04_001304 [Annulohypoxylon sp. FPYF3050]
MDLEDMSSQMVAADTAAEVAAEVAAADPSNRHPKKSSQTCIPCRVRKVRCDGRRDVCQNCERLGFTCSFHDATSPNQDPESLTNFTLPRRRVRCQSQGIECVYKPTKRSGGASSAAQQTQQGTTDSELESVSSEPPEKRVMTSKDNQGSHHGPQGSDHQNFDSNGMPMSTSANREPFTFPDETLIQKTFNNFFRHVHHVPIFSFLHRASLMQRYHAGMMDKALLLALVGITSLLMDLGPGTRDYGARCIDECQTMVLQDLENPSTIKIQALVLIMKHRMLSRKFTTAFMLAATATRFAYALRLNYENPNLCFLARESRRRLMWALLTIDSGINGGCSDFTLMPSESMHVQLPCTERNFEFDLPQVTEYLRPVPTRPFPDDVGSLALHVRLLWMRSRVLYCTKNVLGMPEAELAQLPELVKVLSAELTGFNDHLPASFKFSESNLQLRAYSPRLCVYIMIHNQADLGLTANQVHEIGTRCLTIAKSMDHVPAGSAIVSDLEKLIARGLSTDASQNRAQSPNANGSNLMPQSIMSGRNPIQQMPVMDESGFANIPIISPTAHISSPQGSSMSTPIPHSGHRPPPQQNRGSLPGTPIGNFNMEKPNLAPVMPPEGIDNNNAFEGAMDGFDFNLESFGNTGLESTSWLSGDWLNNDYSQTTV